MIGEPLWTARTGQESKERARHESLINVALAWTNAALMCTYDTRVIDPNVVAEVSRTHPELVVIGGSRPSPSYADPAVFNAEAEQVALTQAAPLGPAAAV